MPTIVFNNSTGSDTTASGSGATNLSGTSASFSGSVVTLDGSPDLSGVLTDSSEVFWLQTDSGRQFFTISGADDGLDQLTLDDAPAGTSTGLTWGYGGKRSTIDNASSRLAFTEMKDDWVIEIEHTGTDYTLSGTALNITAATTSDTVTIRGTGATRPTITQTAAATALDLITRSFSCFIDFLKIENSHASNGGGIDFSQAMSLFLTDCVIGDATNQLSTGIFNSYGSTERLDIVDCEVGNCTSTGVSMQRGCRIFGSWIHDNGGHGIFVGANGGEQLFIFDSIVANNTVDGISLNTQGGRLWVMNCTIDGNTGDGIDVTQGSSRAVPILINNIISNNGGYGFNSDNAGFAQGLVDGNLWYTNTSGDVLNLTKGDNDISGSDPDFTDAASDDYSLSATSPGKAMGFPISTRMIGADQSATTSYKDTGAAQREEAGGGSSRLINGGLVS